MEATLATTATPVSITVPRWTWLALAVALFASYAMLQENGALLSQWQTLHELFHDGRHALGMPCH
jgi:cobalt transporter subunit CbtB